MYKNIIKSLWVEIRTGKDHSRAPVTARLYSGKLIKFVIKQKHWDNAPRHTMGFLELFCVGQELDFDDPCFDQDIL